MIQSTHEKKRHEERHSHILSLSLPHYIINLAYGIDIKNTGASI